MSPRFFPDQNQSWCEDFLRAKLDDPVGQAFLKTLSEIEQKEVQSIVATTKMQQIERSRRFERFVVERYSKSDLNKYGEYIKVGSSPVPGLTLRCILEEHTKRVKSSAWSPDGFLLASAGSDNIGVVWDVKKGAFVIPPKRDGSTVRDLAWAPGHHSLLYSLSDETIWMRDISSGKVRQIFQEYGGRIDVLAWSSDAAFIAAGYWDRNPHGSANRAPKNQNLKYCCGM